MKIVLSKYWRRNSLFIFSLIILLIIGVVAFCAWSRDREDYIMVLCVMLYVLILTCILLCSKRFLTYVVINSNKICAYSFFSKELCTVITTAPIYYAVFTTPQGTLSRKQFIALSNEPFEYTETYGRAKIRFIQHYNMGKQIVMPYDEQTIPLLNLKEWHDVN